MSARRISIRSWISSPSKMPRPTRAQLRRLLEDWGLPQVDPDSYFIGVFPESISIAVDEIERLTAQDRGWTSSQTDFITATNPGATVVTIDVDPVPSENEIIIYRSVGIDLVTANINEVELLVNGVSGATTIWREGVAGGPALPVGRLIGGPNIQTTSFNGLLPIVLDGRDGQSLKLRIRAAASALLTATAGTTSHSFQVPFVGFAT